MDVIAAYRDVGSYRGAAEICGTTHKTVRRIIEAHETGQRLAGQARGRNFDQVRDLVVVRVEKTLGRISAKRLLPQAQAAGYAGRPELPPAGGPDEGGVASWPAPRPPAGVWAPGETLIIDWGYAGRGACVLRRAGLVPVSVRPVRRQRESTTTFGLLAECFSSSCGVPKTVLADRMGCLKSGVVANVVVPTSDYVRFATHYGFRPDFCEAADPESKGMVERLVGYAKQDLMVPQQPFDDLTTANEAAAVWCAEVNTTTHQRSALSRSNGWRWSSRCSARCRRCGWSGVPGRPAGRSTGCRASGSARPATRCRAG